MPRKMIKLSREHKKLVGTSAIQAYHVLKQGVNFPNSEQREITLTAFTENHGAIYSSLGKQIIAVDREAIDTDFLITFSIRRGKKAYITASRW